MQDTTSTEVVPSGTEPITLEWLNSLQGVEKQMALQRLRQRALSNELSLEETRAIVQFMRQGRLAAAEKPAKAKKAAGTGKPRSVAAQAKLINGDDLLADLENF